MSELPAPKRDRRRWLYRTELGTYGPMTTDDVMEAIAARKLTLQTAVLIAGEQRWGVLAEHEIFREHYDECEVLWERQALDAEAEAVTTRMVRRQKASKGMAWMVVTGLIVILGAGGFAFWKLAMQRALELESVVVLPEIAALPSAPALAANPPALPKPTARKVARLSEPEFYDLSGVQIGDGGGAPTRSSLQFELDGSSASGISASALQGVIASARGKIEACGIAEARRDSQFKGTEVHFNVNSGKITGLQVGSDARRNAPFIACVKRALRGVSVPEFSGNPRRVTVPVRFQR